MSVDRCKLDSQETKEYSYNKWTNDEDTKLRKAIEMFGEESWRAVSEYVVTRDTGE